MSYYALGDIQGDLDVVRGSVKELVGISAVIDRAGKCGLVRRYLGAPGHDCSQEMTLRDFVSTIKCKDVVFFFIFLLFSRYPSPFQFSIHILGGIY